MLVDNFEFPIIWMNVYFAVLYVCVAMVTASLILTKICTCVFVCVWGGVMFCVRVCVLPWLLHPIHTWDRLTIPRYFGIYQLLSGIFWVSGIFFGCPEFFLGVRNFFWVSGIFFGCPEFFFGFPEFFFGFPEFFLDVRNFFWVSGIFWVKVGKLGVGARQRW